MRAILTCPECRGKTTATIPEKKCRQFYQCGACRKIITARTTCCVFCDYADVPCPAAGKHAGT